MEAKIRRQLAMADARRGLVLDAARVAFSRLGLERPHAEIAAAGYTVLHALSQTELLLRSWRMTRLQSGSSAPKSQPDRLLWPGVSLVDVHFPTTRELMLPEAGTGNQRAKILAGVHSQMPNLVIWRYLAGTGATPGS